MKKHNMTIYAADGRAVKQVTPDATPGIIGTTDMCPGNYLLVLQQDGKNSAHPL